MVGAAYKPIANSCEFNSAVLVAGSESGLPLLRVVRARSCGLALEDRLFRLEPVMKAEKDEKEVKQTGSGGTEKLKEQMVRKLRRIKFKPF
jgi:hypothetical protein